MEHILVLTERPVGGYMLYVAPLAKSTPHCIKQFIKK